MKISCLPISLFADIVDGRTSLREWAEAARGIGYEGIDISSLFLKNRTPVYVNSVIDDMKAAGMPIIMMTTYPDFTHPDEMQRQRELDYFINDIALSSQLGIPYLRILAGQAHDDMPRDKGIALVVEHFKKAAPVGEKYGVTLLYEDHAKPGAWDKVDFSYPPDIFLEICEGIRDTGIKLNFDTGNLVAYGVNPLDVIPKVFDMVETIHVSDMEQYGTFSPSVIGEGVTPLKEFFEYIKDRGFDGWLCIEEASGNGLEGIKTAYDFVCETWNAI